MNIPTCAITITAVGIHTIKNENTSFASVLKIFSSIILVILFTTIRNANLDEAGSFRETSLKIRCPLATEKRYRLHRTFGRFPDSEYR